MVDEAGDAAHGPWRDGRGAGTGFESAERGVVLGTETEMA